MAPRRGRLASWIFLILSIVCLGAFLLWRSQSTVARPLVVDPTSPVAADTTADPGTQLGELSRQAPISSGDGSDVVARGAGVFVVTIDSSGASVPGAELSVNPWPEGATPVARATSSERNPTFLGELATGRFIVRTARGESVYFRHAAGERTTVQLRVVGQDVEGMVVDEHGSPVSGALLAIDRADEGGAAEIGRSGENGRFSLRCIRSGTVLRALAAGRQPSSPVSVPVSGGGPLVLRLGGSGGALRVRVLDAGTGQGLGGWCYCRARSGQTVAGTGVWTRFATDHAVDPTEGCLVRSMPEGRVEVTIRVDGYAPASTECDVRAFGEEDLVVRMVRGARIEVSVRDTEGAPVAGACASTGRGYGLIRSLTARDGRAVLPCVPPGEITVVATSVGREGRSTMTVADGQEAACTIVLDGAATLTGRCVDETYAPLADLRLELQSATPGTQANATLRTDASGRFELRNCLPIPYRIGLYTEDDQLLPVLQRRLVPADSPFILVVPGSKRESGSLVGHIDDPESASAAVGVSAASREIGDLSLQTTCGQDGHFAVGPLPPDDYALTLHLPGSLAIPMGTFTVAPGEQKDTGSFTRPGSGSYRIVIEGLEGEAFAGVSLRSGSVLVPLERDGATFSRSGIAAGKYSVVTGGALPPVRREVVVLAGAEVDEVLSVVDARGFELSVRVPAIDGTRHFRMELRSAIGSLLRVQTWHQGGDPSVTIPLSLFPGSYDVLLESSDGLGCRNILHANGEVRRFHLEMF